MIHQWLNAYRNRNQRDRTRKLSSRTNRTFGEFEQLEEKRCLAILGFFDGVTLDIVQTADDGDVVVENATGVWRATDNLDTFTFVAAPNITVSMLDNTANKLDVSVDLEHTGNVTLNVGDGVREVNMVSPLLNEIGGDLVINAGADVQIVNLHPDAATALIVHGDVNIDLGTAFDTVSTNDKSLTIDGNLSTVGVNRFDYIMTVGLPGPPPTNGNVTIDTSTEAIESFFISQAASTFYGDFTYTGGVDIDHVTLGVPPIPAITVDIFGTTNIDLGVGVPFFGDPQSVITFGTKMDDITIVAGDSNLGNDILLHGAFTGNIVSYTGGNLVDIVTWQMDAAQADVFINMGDGDDVFNLMTTLNLLEIDYGNDVGDIFNNQLGLIDFEFDITNFHWFDHFYTALNDTLVMNQLADTGNILMDNDGGITGFDWRMFPAIGGTSSTARAENLILNLLSNTGNDLEMDLFNPVIASITMNLGDGDRNVEFTGISNNPLRDIRINADAGNQHVDLSVNHPLGVATLDVDLGSGFDTVDDNANNLTIDEDLIFRGVNHFENDGVLLVTRNAIIDTSGENEDTVFANNSFMHVGATFTYTGGDGSDELRLNGAGGTTITEEALIDLGDSVGGGAQVIRLDHVDTTFNRSLTVSSSNSTGTDEFATVPGTEFNGNLSIDLGGGPNLSNITGVFGGSAVSYNGGSGADHVTYGLTGTDPVLTVNMGGGDDTFILQAGASIASPLTIDFGGGFDTFTNNYGTFDFDANLLNLNGFNHVYTHATQTLASTQVSDPGYVLIDNNGPGQAIRFTNLGTSTLTPADNLIVQLQDGSSTNLDVDLANTLAGDLEVHLGDGSRDFNLVGADNSIGGELQVTGGSGDQVVEVAVNNALTVGGNATFSLGTGNDTVDEDGNNVDITGNLSLLNVNTFVNNAVLTVGGNVTVDVSLEANSSVFADNSPILISGDFTYIGSDGADQIVFDATTSVGGNIFIDAGNGANDAVLVNILGGSSVTYRGGSGTDSVVFGTTGTTPTLDIQLGAGDDTFTLLAGASFTAPLVVDFGAGADTFVNGFGVFTFDAVLSGLGGFNHAYDFSDGRLTSTQVEDIGSITVDDNGLANSIRFTDGGTSSLTPVTHLTVNLMNGSTGNLEIDLDNALAGNLAVNLGNGVRAFNLTGSSNSIGGDLNIQGGSDSQTVELAVNNSLSVGGNLRVNPGSGHDVVDEDGNNIDVTGNVDFGGVNFFENDGTMNVGGHLTINNSGETSDSLFDDNATMSIAGDFSFTGGQSADNVSLNGVGGTTIGGNAFINLGGNNGVGTQSAAFDLPGASVGGTLTVISTNSATGDSFTSHAANSFGGNINVNLGDGPNTAEIVGVFGGSNVNYTGGSGVDDLTFGTTGNQADVSVDLGSGDDTFTLLAGSSISPTTLTVDFGDNNDTFNNLYGNFDFNAVLNGLNSFDHSYNFGTNSLTSDQISPSGPVTIDDSGTGNAIRFTDGVTSELTTVDNLTVNFLSGPGADVNVTLDAAFSGDLTLNLGDGTRDLNLDGLSNSIGGDLSISAGTSAQNVELAVNNALSVGGNATIDLGQGKDVVDEDGNDVTVTGALSLTGVNAFNNEGNLLVGGNVSVDNSGENEVSEFDDNGSMTIGGDFDYLGGISRDRVTLDGPLGSTIAGNAMINVGNNTFGGSQFISLDNPGSSVGGTLTIRSTATLNTDTFVTHGSTGIGGDVNIHLGGGLNNATILGAFGGSNVKYNGGIGTDNVTFGTTGNPANTNIKLGGGDDNFVLGTGASIGPALRVDFGGGDDSFTNHFGAFTFDGNLLNWHGYNRFYDIATNSLNMQQIADTGDIILDNNGAGNAIRLINGATTEMTPASNVRLILMDNTSTDITVDLDSALTGQLVLQLRSGNRDVSFIGSSNSVGDLLRVEASTGIQTVNLTAVADLNVGGSLVINGRNGSDTVNVGSGNITVGNAMILRGINTFVNTNDLNVAGDFNMITSLETEKTLFGNTGTMNIGGNVTYIAGNGVDSIQLNSGGVNVAGLTYFDVGNAFDIQPQTISLTNGFTSAGLVIAGGNAFGGNNVITDNATTVNGIVIVDFTGTSTTSTVVLKGNYTGNYGTFRGGSARDNVEFSATAAGMDFVALTVGGNDVFTLESTTDLNSLLVDFGTGTDTFNDNIGQPYPFPVTVLNLP